MAAAPEPPLLQPAVGRNDPSREWQDFEIFFSCEGTKSARHSSVLFEYVEQGRMFSLIRFIQGWLWPVAEEVPAQAQDSTSMADLVRLLETSPDSSATASPPATDAADGSGT